MRLNLTRREGLCSLLLVSWTLLLIAYGGVHPLSLGLFNVVVATLFVWSLYLARNEELILPLLPLFVFWVGLTLVQILPLPESLLVMLSPKRHAMSQWVAPFVGRPSMTLSLAPELTLRVLMQMLSYAMLFFVARRIFDYEDLKYRSVKWVVAALSIFSLHGLLQRVTDQPLAFGYAFRSGNGFSSFVSPNQAAIILSMGLSLALGGYLLSSDRREKIYFGATAFVQALGCLFCFSRFSLIACALSFTAALLYYFFIAAKRPGAGGVRQNLKVLITALVLLTGVGVYLFFVLGTEEVVSEASRLDRKTLSESYRLELWRQSLGAWLLAPLFGFGLGCYELALTVHRDFLSYLRPEHAESDFIEVLVTGGLLGFVALLLLWRSVWRRLWQQRHAAGFLYASLSVAALCALFATSVHFVFENGAIMVLLIVLLAMIYPNDRKTSSVGVQTMTRLLLHVGVAGFFLFFIYFNVKPLFVSNDCASAAPLVDSDAALIRELEAAEACIEQQPFSARYYLRYAHALMRTQPAIEDPLPYLRLAAKLDPTNPAIAYTLGRQYYRINDYTTAKRHLQASLQASRDVTATSRQEMVRLLTMIDLHEGAYSEAEAKIRQFRNLGGSNVERALLWLRAKLLQDDFLESAQWLTYAIENDQNALVRVVQQLLAHGSLEKPEHRYLLNTALLASSNIAEALNEVEPLLSEAILTKAYGGKLHAVLPNWRPDQQGIVYRRFDKTAPITIKSSSQYEAMLASWSFSVQLRYPTSSNSVDRFGINDFSLPIGAGHITIELFVYSPYRPKRQLGVVLREGADQRQRFASDKVLPIGEGWYSMTLNLEEVVDRLGPPPYYLEELSFNTAWISGEYVFSSYRIFAN